MDFIYVTILFCSSWVSVYVLGTVRLPRPRRHEPTQAITADNLGFFLCVCVTQELFYPLRVSNYGDCDQKVSGFRKQRETTRAVGGVPCSKGRYDDDELMLNVLRCHLTY